MEPAVLEEVRGIFLNYFPKMFALPLEHDGSPPEQAERPPFSSEIFAYIGLAGVQHQGQLTLGFSRNFAKRMIEKFVPDLQGEDLEDFTRSAIGETLNSLAGMIGSSAAMVRLYPDLSQSLPVINDTTHEGRVYFSKSDGAALRFSCGDESLHVFLGLVEFIPTQIKNQQEDIL